LTWRQILELISASAAFRCNERRLAVEMSLLKSVFFTLFSLAS
jgi:hypothetical protein